MAAKRKLTCVNAGQRWRKIFKGQVFYGKRGVQKSDDAAYRQTLEEFEKRCGKISKPETYSHPHGQPYKAAIKRREDMLRVCELENLEDQYSERCRDGVVQSIRATSLPKDDEYQDRADRQLQAVENDF